LEPAYPGSQTLRAKPHRVRGDETGRVYFDRRLPGSFTYPADYGYIAGAAGSDGEPLDALVLPDQLYSTVPELNS